MPTDTQGTTSFFRAFETLPGTVITLLVTGLIGGILTTVFQYKSWKETTRQERIVSDLNNAYMVLLDTSKLVTKRWFASTRVVSHLDDDDKAVAWSEYQKSVVNWNEAYNTTLIEIDYKIEGLSSYRLNPSWERVENINCDHIVADQLKHPADDDLDSPQGYLLILHNCFIQVGKKISSLHEGKIKPEIEKAKVIAEVKTSLDMIQRHFVDFRRLCIDKLNAYRSEKELRTIWQFIQGH